jgi:hypothetical protein
VALPVTLAELCQSLNNSHSIASPSFVTGRAVALTCPELCHWTDHHKEQRVKKEEDKQKRKKRVNETSSRERVAILSVALSLSLCFLSS